MSGDRTRATPGAAVACEGDGVHPFESRPSLGVHWTRHAREQMAARDLLMGDVLHVLKHGFVYDEAEPATQIGLFKYKIESATPNSFGRTVRVVVIPSMSSEVKIVTVMWKDER